MRSRKVKRRSLPTPRRSAAGAIAGSMLLVATSAVPVTPAGAPTHLRPPADKRAAPHDIGRPAPLPATYRATESVENSGDPAATIPTVFTPDIPTTVLNAYRHAREVITKAQLNCHLPIELLEAIGKVETNHARGGLVDGTGTTQYPILGPVLDGNGFATIPDTDHGRLDADPEWDRAIGPMQFLPGTWIRWAADGNGDHRADPDNVYDASLTAARYLCADNRDLGTPDGLNQAISSYNRSASYRKLVLAWMLTYVGGTTSVPDAAALATPTTAVPAGNTSRPAPVPAQPAVPSTPSQPPTTTPPATTPTQPPTIPATPPTSAIPPPPVDPATGNACAPTGLLGAVTGLVGSLLGSLTGGDCS